jgi:hypothetical protein
MTNETLSTLVSKRYTAGIRDSPSKSIRAIDAPEIVHTRLFPKLRRSGDERKTKAKASDGEEFDSYYQICNQRFFHHAPAILESVTIKKYVTCSGTSLGAKEKIPAELDPCAVGGKVRSS